jgi:hypothetical protein
MQMCFRMGQVQVWILQGAWRCEAGLLLFFFFCFAMTRTRMAFYVHKILQFSTIRLFITTSFKQVTGGSSNESRLNQPRLTGMSLLFSLFIFVQAFPSHHRHCHCWNLHRVLFRSYATNSWKDKYRYKWKKLHCRRAHTSTIESHGELWRGLEEERIGPALYRHAHWAILCWHTQVPEHILETDHKLERQNFAGYN